MLVVTGERAVEMWYVKSGGGLGTAPKKNFVINFKLTQIYRTLEKNSFILKCDC